MHRKEKTVTSEALSKSNYQKNIVKGPAQPSLFVYRGALLSLVLLALATGAVYLTLPASLDRSILAETIEERSGWLNVAFLTLTNTFTPANIVLLSLVTSLFIWCIGKSKWQALQVLSSVALSSVLAQIIKHLVGRSRPDLSLQLVHETDLSFPSGHATGIVALATSLALVILWRKDRRSALAFLETGVLVVLAVLICCSRVYVGAHWATDVSAGVLLGFGTTVVVFTALAATARRFRPYRSES